MDKVGIPRSLFYYYDGNIWKSFFDCLGVSYIVSPPTNREIMDRGIYISNDEMCLSMKNYLGHIDYLKDKCEYILVPRVCNFGRSNQTCTNFWAAYDIIHNLFNVKILNYNIDLEKGDTLKKGLFKIGRELGYKYLDIYKAYNYAVSSYNVIKRKNMEVSLNKLYSKNTKILIVSHSYNLYDEFIGKPILSYLKSEDVEIVYSSDFDSKITNKLSTRLSKDLYFKYNRDNIGSVVLSLDRIDGIIFISSFPCGPDSLVNELVIRKVKKPILNLIIDSNFSFVGLETRLESFLDVIRGEVNV